MYDFSIETWVETEIHCRELLLGAGGQFEDPQRKAFLQYHQHRNGVWGRGCDEAEISEEKRLLTERGQGIQRMKALASNPFFRKGNSVKRSRPFSEEVRAIL